MYVYHTKLMPPLRTQPGDHGQPYEIIGIRPDGSEQTLGWTNECDPKKSHTIKMFQQFEYYKNWTFKVVCRKQGLLSF